MNGRDVDQCDATGIDLRDIPDDTDCTGDCLNYWMEPAVCPHGVCIPQRPTDPVDKYAEAVAMIALVHYWVTRPPGTVERVVNRIWGLLPSPQTPTPEGETTSGHQHQTRD